MGQNCCVTYAYEYRIFLIISEIIKQKIKCTRTVALCIRTGVDYFLIFSEIIKQET